MNTLDAMILHYNAQLRDSEKATQIIGWFKYYEQLYIRDWMIHCKP